MCFRCGHVRHGLREQAKSIHAAGVSANSRRISATVCHWRRSDGSVACSLSTLGPIPATCRHVPEAGGHDQKAKLIPASTFLVPVTAVARPKNGDVSMPL